VVKVKKRARAVVEVAVEVTVNEAEIVKTVVDGVNVETVEIEAIVVIAESEVTEMSVPLSRVSVNSASRSSSTRRLASTLVPDLPMEYRAMPSLRM
jgi:hypothetical protein